jgi:very-short-patch-repair endonuclease
MEENRQEIFIVTARQDKAKQALALWMRRKMTPSERLLWHYLRASRLGGLHFRRQQIIGGFIADFFCHEARLIVELDGPIHEDQRAYDAERDHILAAYGLCILRFANDELWTGLNGVRRKILETARAQCPRSVSVAPRPTPGASADPSLGGKGG